jgi:hypothetical protein
VDTKNVWLEVEGGNAMSLLNWFDKRAKQQNDFAVAEMLRRQEQDPRPLHARLQDELDNDSMPECRFMLISKTMISEAIADLRYYRTRG